MQIINPFSAAFQSSLSVWEVVEELRQLMKEVPMYSAHFMAILSEVLMGYRDSLRLLYNGLFISSTLC